MLKYFIYYKISLDFFGVGNAIPNGPNMGVDCIHTWLQNSEISIGGQIEGEGLLPFDILGKPCLTY